jgi:hypothetical protein
MKVANVTKRFIPNTKAIGKAPYFTMKIVDMKAWQLYIGQSLFLVVVGIIFWLLNSLLRSLGIKNKYIDTSVSALRNVATGEVTSQSGIDVLKSVF